MGASRVYEGSHEELQANVIWDSLDSHQSARVGTVGFGTSGKGGWAGWTLEGGSNFNTRRRLARGATSRCHLGFFKQLAIVEICHIVDFGRTGRGGLAGWTRE